MAEYDNTNRGVLFKVLDKEEESHADYNGNINVDGQEFWLNGWIKTSKKGDKFLSLSVKPKNQRQRSQGQSRQSRRDDDSGIPF